MTRMRGGLVSTRYRSSVHEDRPRTVLEAFVRLEDGRSAVLLVSGVRPFIHIAPRTLTEPDAILAAEALIQDERITAVVGPFQRWTDRGMQPHWRLDVAQPFLVPQLREALEATWVCTSADIPFANRLLLEGDLGIHITFEGSCIDERDLPDADAEHRVLEAGGSGRYGTDLTYACQLDDLASSEAFEVPWRHLSFDLETSVEHDVILCAVAWAEVPGPTGMVRSATRFSGDEASIMKGLTSLVRRTDPDLITGYNIENFDLPRLEDRARVHLRRGDWEGMSEHFGWGRGPRVKDEVDRRRDGLLPRRSTGRSWTIGGRVVMDAWWQARTTLRPERETLAFVSGLLFPDDDRLQKMDVDASKMDEEWDSRPDVVLDYCERDALLPLEILEAIRATRRKEAIGSVAKVTLETAVNGSTSQLLDSLVVRLAEQRGVAVPRNGSADRKDGPIEGGYVHDVEAGVHPWIAILDFKSMYPSIMIAHNICYTTRLDREHDALDQSVHISPSGVAYMSAEERRGLVPELLERLMAQRDHHKAERSRSEASGDAEGAAFHDRLQEAVKILMNSFYGVFASEFYRFTHRDLGSSITAWARHNIKEIIRKVEDEGHPVVYSDTDSIFVRAPIGPEVPPILEDDGEASSWLDARASLIEFGMDLAKRHTRDGAVLEFEKALSVFFSHGAKKRYVGKVIWPSEATIVRGYETQRTDSFRALTEGMMELFEAILAGDHEAAIAGAIARIQSVRSGNMDPRALVISKSCKGTIRKDGSVDFHKHYANPNGMAPVQAARKRIALNLPFTSGMKIGYVVTNADRRPMVVEPWLEDRPDGGIDAFDGEFYARRLAKAFGRVTEAFDWTGEDLLKGNRQASLFSF